MSSKHKNPRLVRKVKPVRKAAPGPKDPRRFTDWDETTVRITRAVRKYDPSQPRDPEGSATGGQWTDGGASGGPLKVGAHGTTADAEAARMAKDARQREWDRMAEYGVARQHPTHGWLEADPGTRFFLSKYPTLADYDEASRASLEDLAGNSLPAMQVPLTVLTGKVDDSGEFLSTFDTSKSGSKMGGGDDYLAMRRGTEGQLFGIAGDAPGSGRPKYGFLLDSNAEAHVRDGVPQQYGDATVVFRQAVRERVTFTAGDSLDMQGRILPSPLGSPSHLSSFPGDNLGTHMRNLDRVRPKSGSIFYDEAQYHGRLSTSDISHVYLRAEPNKTQRGKLEKMSARLGFTWSVVLP